MTTPEHANTPTDGTEQGQSSGAAHDKLVRKLRQRDDRPNLLILLTDQQRADTIRAAGATWMHTPNLDRLAAGGRLYHNAYSPNPICVPARHNLLTGLTARHHGYYDNRYDHVMPRHLPTFPQLLSDHGYEARAIGKCHFHPPRRHHGYLNLELMEEVPQFREQDEYLMHLKRAGLGHIHNIHGVRNLLYMLPQRALMPEQHHGTAWVADRTIDFLRTNHGRHPWLLTANWIAPHPPFNVPAEYADLYKNAHLPAPATSETPISPLAKESRALGDLPAERYVQRMRALYYAAVSHVDHHVGRILDALEETGQLDNTLIVFTSDHGEMLGDHGTYQKWLPYDSSAKIPMIVHWPERIAAGEHEDRFVDLNDLLPTLFDAADVPLPEGYDYPGESLLRADGEKDRDHQYIEYSAGNRRWVSLRNHRYKYNYYYADGAEELFDLQEDPAETRNLLVVDRRGHEAIRTDLRERLIRYEQRWGLPGNIEAGDFVQRSTYQPQPYRNRAFPLFHEKLTDPQEKAAMNPFLDEVVQAVRDEPVVQLEELDLATWQKNGGFTDEQVRDVLANLRRKRAPTGNRDAPAREGTSSGE